MKTNSRGLKSVEGAFNRGWADENNLSPSKAIRLLIERG